MRPDEMSFFNRRCVEYPHPFLNVKADVRVWGVRALD